MVLVETQLKELIVMVNPNEIRDAELDLEDLKSEYLDTFQNMEGNDLTLKLELGSFEKISCSARDDDCRPLIGGLTVANEDETGDDHLGTLGYKAKVGSTVGFVITGHQAGAQGKDIIQPHDDVTEIVGEVDVHQENSDCDCAFVDVDGGISVNNEIYKSSNNVYTITGEVPESSQTVNSWVYKSGARTAVTLGEIKGFNDDDVLLYIYHGKGDSGSPVFDITSGDDVDLYGMIHSGVINPALSWAQYHTWDHIENEIGASLP